jgi:hypothetical protein
LKHQEPLKAAGLHPDCLCTLATGGGLSTRELYSDTEETLLDAMRPIALNGITDFVSRPDLVDRSLSVELPAIPEDKRKQEAELLVAYAKEAPYILGALLAVAAQGLANLSGVHLGALPRMADFAAWVVACCPALGWQAEDFLAEFNQSRQHLTDSVLDCEPIVPHLHTLAAEGEWTGTAAALLDTLMDCAHLDGTKRLPDGWPKNVKALGHSLRRLAPALRTQKIVITFYRESGTHERARKIRVSTASDRVGKQTSETSETSDAYGDSAPTSDDVLHENVRLRKRMSNVGRS